jgi:hypothetical protein
MNTPSVVSTYSLCDEREKRAPSCLWQALESLFSDREGVQSLYLNNMLVTLLRGSDRERQLLEIFESYQVPVLPGYGVAAKHPTIAAEVRYSLEFAEGPNDLYLLRDHYCPTPDIDQEPAWFLRDGKCWVSAPCLECFTRLTRDNIIMHHERDNLAQLPKLIPTRIKEQLERQNLFGFETIPVQAFSYRIVSSTTQPPDPVMRKLDSRGLPIADIKPVDVSPEQKQWWALVPPLVMPRVHPLFNYYDPRLRYDQRTPITDPCTTKRTQNSGESLLYTPLKRLPPCLLSTSLASRSAASRIQAAATSSLAKKAKQPSRPSSKNPHGLV